MPTPFLYENQVLRKWEEYCRFLQKDRAKTILNAYSRVGGDASRLRGALWWGLREIDYPPVIPDLQTLQAMQRLLRGLEAIPDMQGLKDVDESLWERVRGFTDVQPALQKYCLYLSVQRQRSGIIREFNKLTRSLKLPPRRRGHASKTLTAAVLVKEFREKFRRPRYREAAILLYEAAPRLFDDPAEEEDAAKLLARLVRRVLPDTVTRTHARLFMLPDPFKMAVELRPYPVRIF